MEPELMQPSDPAWDYDLTILGEPASLKNSRRIVKLGGLVRSIKSAKAMRYCDAFVKQIPAWVKPLAGDIYIHVDAYYASRRPDLSCLDIIKDLLQGHSYENDRQVKAESAIWNLDRSNPRTRIRIREIASSKCIEQYSETLFVTLDQRSQ